MTLYALNCATAAYCVNGGEAVAYNNGDVINLGAELGNNETVAVALTGYDADGSVVAEASSTYTKYYHEDVEPVSVLFIGNSYTFYNDGVWTHFQKLAYAAGYNAAVDQVTIGSHRLYQFADPNESDPAGGPVVEQKLTDNVYDYVFLQEQSTAPVDQYAQFESSVVTLSNRIEQHNADAVVILYQTWGRETGSSDLTGRGWTNETMTCDLAYAYDKAAELVGATEEQLADIALRGYDGNVAAIGTAIRADGDVDVMIGVGENFDAPTTEGGPAAGVPIQEKNGGICMGTSGKNRWMARITGDEVAVLVYEWIKANYTTAP